MADPSFEAFLADVRRRLERGRAVFADRSLELSGRELLTEIQEELADVAGWSALLWVRLERLRDELRRVDPGPDHAWAFTPSSEASGDAPQLPLPLVGPDRESALDALGAVQADPDPERERERSVRVLGGRCR